jgi:cytochrome P450
VTAIADAEVPSTDLDVYDPVLQADPFPVYQRLRSAGPLHRRYPGIYLVPRYAECNAVLADPAWGHGYSAGISPFRPGVDISALPGSFLLMDPPDHTRLRRLVTKEFTTRAVAAARERITTLVDELLNEAIGAGEVDLVSGLTIPVPLTTICQLLGIPVADRAAFGHWAPHITRGLDPDAVLSPAEVAARTAAVQWFRDYFAALIEERTRQSLCRSSGSDIVSELARSATAGGELSAAELADMCLLLLIGGFETTSYLITGGVLALSRHPDQWDLLRQAPGLLPKAVEELVRYDSPVPFPTRVALTEAEVAGHRMARGTGLVLLVGSANHDSRAYADPDRLDLTRFARGNGVPPHLSFSHGPHFCLGAPLAKLEAEITFERLARRTARITVLTDRPEYRPGISVRGLARLPVRLEASQ